MADNTPYDSAFKTMLHRMPSLLVPFINEAFGRDYPLDEPIVRLCDEHESGEISRFADSVFRLRDKLYHVECQSTADADMAVRMIEYDFAIALEETLAAGAPYEMNFPESCVLFLRRVEDMPDTLNVKVNLPDGQSFNYKSKVMKAQAFSSEDIFKKRLLILLPYYLMRYEKALGSIEGNDVETAKLVAECAELRAQLEEATLGKGMPLLYEQMTELIIRVIDHMMKAHDALRRIVRRTMGGEVWELMHERAERLEREAREEGIEQGIEQGIDSLAKKLTELGVEELTIKAAVDAVRADQENK